MTRYLNRWTVSGAWVILMAALWALYVPGAITFTSFVVLAATGPLLVIVLSALWRSQQPAPSAGQQRVQTDEAEAAARARK
jgi:hypothetical protein